MNKPPENLWIALAPSRTKETEFECLAFTEEPAHGALKYLMNKYVHISVYDSLKKEKDHLELVFADYQQNINFVAEKILRLEKEIKELILKNDNLKQQVISLKVQK